MTVMPNPFITEAENRFVLDERLFMEAIEAKPAFLAEPRPEYLDALPIVRVLAAALEARG